MKPTRPTSIVAQHPTAGQSRCGRAAPASVRTRAVFARWDRAIPADYLMAAVSVTWARSSIWPALIVVGGAASAAAAFISMGTGCGGAK